MNLPPEQPTITTTRLLLRPFALEDAPAVQRLAGAREVAATTLNIPHPYDAGMAETWIGTHAQSYAEERIVTYAVTAKTDGTLMGAVGLHLDPPHSRGELGYWIGLPFWNQGYTTEAAAAILAFGFETVTLNRIYASHMAGNPASGRVMEKLGMTNEAVLREHLQKWGVFVDVVSWGILASEWKGAGT